MSCELMKPEVLVGLARAVKDLRRGFDSPLSWEEITNTLAVENVKSHQSRYEAPGVAVDCVTFLEGIQEEIRRVHRDSPMMGFIEIVNTYDGTKPVQWLRTIDFIQYHSEAHRDDELPLFNQMRQGFIRALPGYDAAHWGGPGGE